MHLLTQASEVDLKYKRIQKVSVKKNNIDVVQNTIPVDQIRGLIFYQARGST